MTRSSRNTRRTRFQAPPLHTLPIVAIVGRPNVGKSTLFNRLTRTRRAAVYDMPGVTRDRNYGSAEYRGRFFCVVDTGGFEALSGTLPLIQEMREQALIAIHQADVVVLLADVNEPDNPTDREMVQMLRRSNKPFVLAVNKCEKLHAQHAALEFARLGIDPVFPMSAQHGEGVAEMLDLVLEKLPAPAAETTVAGLSIREAQDVWDEDEEMEDASQEAIEELEEFLAEDEDDDNLDDDHDASHDEEAETGKEVEDSKAARRRRAREEERIDLLSRTIRLAIVGRQNVGKSTLINQLTGENRVIASAVPGTTRDAIDTPLQAAGRNWILVDTAGIRRRSKSGSGLEGLTAMSSLLSMERADVALLLIDGSEGITAQDKHIAGYAIDRGCCVVIAVNKWDIVEKDHRTADQFTKKIRQEMPFLEFAPVVYISALTGQRATKVIELAAAVYEQACTRIETPELNHWLGEATGRFPPPIRENRRLSIKFINQTGVLPPSFQIFCNDPKLMHFSYQRYLSNSLREAFDLDKVPVRLKLRRKSSQQREFPSLLLHSKKFRKPKT